MDNPNVSGRTSESSASVTEELIAAAITGIIRSAWTQGQSLDELRALVLEDDLELDCSTRQWLSEIVVEAWQDLCESAALEPA